MTPEELLQLEAELTKDPAGIGYDVFGVNKGLDQAVADLINAVRAGSSVPRASIPIEEFLDAIFLLDMTPDLTDAQQAYFVSITGQASLRLQRPDGSDTNIIKALSTFISGDSLTRLQALAVSEGTRSEELFGAGVMVTNKDIAEALRG